ncbi:hypothetical protein FQN57_003103 [Myotisia sp. PD_48]|nr:hypothetical protein FQN57_003103 [Myotisia sp. PD_48]
MSGASPLIIPFSPGRPPTATMVRNRRQSLVLSRACDRCKQKKIKCDFGDSGCTSCRLSGRECSFEIPVRKRGPKLKPQRRSAPATQSLSPSVGHGSIYSARTEELSSLTPPASNNPSLDVIRTPTCWPRTISPETTFSSPPVIQSPEINRTPPLLPVTFSLYDELTAGLSQVNPSLTLDAIATQCFELYFNYIFPLIPILHKPTVKKGLDFFLAQSRQSVNRGATAFSNVVDQITSRPASWPEFNFTLITGLCAESASILPSSIFPGGRIIAEPFLQVSRKALQAIWEADLERPTADSVVIRYFHSNCLHAAGKPAISWQIFGEATRLAQIMELHDEASYEGLDPIEAEIRRRVFWILHTGDKSAAILNSRPITIHKYSFDKGINVRYPSGYGERQHELGATEDLSSTTDNTSLRPNIIEGFNANVRLWHAASDFLLELRRIRDETPALSDVPPPLLSNEQTSHIQNLYVTFITCLDHVPPPLQLDYLDDRATGEPPEKQSNAINNSSLWEAYMVQRLNLQVSFHCLRMVVIQKFEEYDISLPDVNPEQSHMVLLRKTEIARDMLRAIRGAPFWVLQVNGESCVEKIRLIGASLLEIIHKTENPAILSRARTDFGLLLDILARLDSKASDTLRNSTSWGVHNSRKSAAVPVSNIII